MKKILFPYIIVLCLTSNAQQTINLSTGSITNGNTVTSPTRNVNVTDDGAVVTYDFFDVLTAQDPLYPSYNSLRMKGFTPNYVAGQPDIFFRTDAFYVPIGSHVSVEIIDCTYIDIPMMLAPARPPLSMEGEYYYTTNNVPEIEPYEGFFPQNILEYTGIMDYRGEGIARVTVRPVQYDYANHVVRLYKHLAYRFRYVETPASRANSTTNRISYDDNFIENTVLNNEATKKSKIKAMARSQGEQTAILDNIGYLIVSVPRYRESVKRLMDWKRQIGFTVDTLIGNWQQSDTTTILNAITQRYNNNNNLNYLLIIGNKNDVPTFTRSLYLPTGEFDFYHPSKFYEHPTDLYYGLVNNATGTAHLKRGRITVNNEEETDVVVDKIINYEKNPVMDVDFYKTGLHIAQYQDNDTDYYEDYRFTLTSEEIRNYMLSLGKVINRIYSSRVYPDITLLYWNNNFYSNGGLVPDSTRVVFSSLNNYQTVIDNINSGVFYTLYYDHGTDIGWQSPPFNSDKINYLNNGNKLPFVISCCCHTGKFSNINCFAGMFLKKQEGGAIGVIAASDVIATGFSDILLESMFSHIWPENGISIETLGSAILNTVDYSNIQPVYRLGNILDESLYTMIFQTYGISLQNLSGVTVPASTVNNFILHTCEIFNLFGDPAMELFTDVPQNFSPPIVNTSDNIIHVSTTDGDARISIYNQTTGDISSYVGNMIDYTYNGSDDVKVAITRHNYIPYLIDIGRDIYIQNEAIQGGRVYKGNNIYVGKNVTSDKPEGEVVFKSGSNTTMKAGTVILDRGTTVDIGATLNVNE